MNLTHFYSAKADPEKGRFRDLLKTMVSRFYSDRVGKKAPKGVRFQREFVSLEALKTAEEQIYKPAAGESEKEVFDRQWAITTCRNVVRAMEPHYSGDKREMYDIFVVYRLPAEKWPTQKALAAQFGKTENQIAAILKKTTKHFARLIKAELRAEGVAEDEIDGEVDSMTGEF